MTNGLSRVTVVAPRMRIDLALPTDVTLADLLPTLLRYSGDGLADDAGARAGWVLARLGGLTMDSSWTLGQHQVRDGELLYLQPLNGAAPRPVFDDVVDAVATAIRGRRVQWSAGATRRFGLGLAAAALVAGVVAVLFAGPPRQTNGLVGLGTAVALLVVAVLFARVLGDVRAAVVAALVAALYAAVGGLVVFAGDRPLAELTSVHLLVAGTAVALTTAIAAVGVGTGAGPAAPVLICVGGSAVAAQLTAIGAMVFGVPVAAAAAVTVTVVYAAQPLFPVLAYRLSRLPMPVIPTQSSQLRQEVDRLDAERLLQLSARTDGYLVGMVGTVAVVGAGTAILVARAGRPGLALAVIVSLLMLSRARLFLSAAQRLPLLVAGLVGLAACALAAFAVADHTVRLVVVYGAIVAVAAISAAFGLAGAREKASPVWGRLLDIGETLLTLVLLPLAVWVSGLYAWIRSVRG